MIKSQHLRFEGENPEEKQYHQDNAGELKRHLGYQEKEHPGKDYQSDSGSRATEHRRPAKEHAQEDTTELPERCGGVKKQCHRHNRTGILWDVHGY